MFRLIGSFTLGEVLPMGMQLAAALQALAGAELPAAELDLGELRAELPKLEANLGAQLAIVKAIQDMLLVDPSALLSGILEMVTSGKFVLGLTLAAPSLIASLQASLTAARAASASFSAKLGAISGRLPALTIRIGKLTAALTLSAEVFAQLAAGGIRLYVYEGSLGRFGIEVDEALHAGITGGIDLDVPVWIPVLVTDRPATATATRAVMRAE